MHEVRDDEAAQRLEDHRGDREQTGLVDDQPERIAPEEELEVPETDEARHALVQRREVDRIAGRIGHQDGDQQNEGKRHQEGDGRLALHQLVQAAALAACADGRITGRDICHDLCS